MRDKDITYEQLAKELQELRQQGAREKEEIQHTRILLQTIIDESSLVIFVKKKKTSPTFG